jgi:uncharacterized coiled-coil protein SlyX
MPDDNNTTEQIPQPSLEARVTALEANFSAQSRVLNDINDKLDTLIRMQQEMYVDLRGRLAVLTATVNQIQQDLQPDSFQNRILNIRR